MTMEEYRQTIRTSESVTTGTFRDRTDLHLVPSDLFMAFVAPVHGRI